ncbi:hypothetical protein ACOME3_010476 [Neoechinorhynchus agilis]
MFKLKQMRLFYLNFNKIILLGTELPCGSPIYNKISGNFKKMPITFIKKCDFFDFNFHSKCGAKMDYGLDWSKSDRTAHHQFLLDSLPARIRLLRESCPFRFQEQSVKWQKRGFVSLYIIKIAIAIETISVVGPNG